MNAPVILDSSVLLAIALIEKRGEKARSLIRASRGYCYIHSVNAYEVASKLMIKGANESDAWDAAAFGGVILIDEISDEMSRLAARLKVPHQYLSLGDCHCLAFAEEMGGQLLITDERLAGASKIVKTVHLQ